MSIVKSLNSISCIESNAADTVKEFASNPEDIALLNLIVIGRNEYEAGRYQTAEAFFAEMDKE